MGTEERRALQNGPTELPAVAEDAFVLRVDSVFDGTSAWRLRHAIDRVADESRPVIVDFSAVREFYDFGVAILAHGLAQRGDRRPSVRLRGLRTHQLRMFRYFGIDA